MKTFLFIILLTFISFTTFSQEKIEVTKIKASHRKVYTEIIIDASPKEVWAVLTNFESYKVWSSFFKGMTGEIKNNGKVITTFQMNPKKDKLARNEHVLLYNKGKSFGWSDTLLLGIKDNHYFSLEETSNGKTRFIQTDEFKNGATWLLGRYITNLVRQRYSEFNISLKEEVEKSIH